MRKEFAIGTAIGIIGICLWFVGQMNAAISPTLGWIIIIVCASIRIFLFGYGFGKRSDDSTRASLVNSQIEIPSHYYVNGERVEINQEQWRGFTKAEMAEISMAALQMLNAHQHVDWLGLFDAQKRRVSLNVDACWICRRPRFQSIE